MPRKIILASSSFHRKMLLEQIGLKNFEIVESEYEEDMSALEDPIELAKFLALKKAEDVAKKFEDAIIIAGDTFAVFEGKFIGKPKDKKEAKERLLSFSEKEVWAVSGFAIIDTKTKEVINDFGEGKIKFRKIFEEELDDYLMGDEALKLAGGFGVLKRAAVFMESFSGDFFSIVGLPIGKIYLELRKMGINSLRQ